MASGGKRPGAGRPKGVPNKIIPEVKLAAREYTVQALETLARIMLKGESEGAKVSAANALLDRGWGKPAQSITGEGGGPVAVAVEWRVVDIRPAGS